VSDLDPELFRLTFLETPNPSVVTDENLLIAEVNDACVEFTGYSRAELLGTPPSFLVDDPTTYEEIVESLAAGDHWEGDVEAVAKSGDRVPGHGATFPLVADGDLRGYGGIFVDLAARRRYERTIQVLNRVLRHNIRNDANVVAGVLETLREAVPAENRNLLEAAIQRVDRLVDRAETARDLNALLDRDAALGPVRLDERVRRVVDRELRGETRLTLSLPDDPAYVLADGALPAVVEAVVENAVDHTGDDPSVWVTVESTDERVVLTVADDGPGIDPHRAGYLFGRRAETPLRHGQGLSLFFVDRVMDLYGGSVSYRPRDPDGSVFELAFRAAAPADGE
jgi:PAS domain S-box-containing protein